MAVVVSKQVKVEVIEIWCGHWVALTETQLTHFENTGARFVCPFGDGASYSGKVIQLEKDKERLEGEVNYAWQQQSIAVSDAKTAKREVATQKGKVTKLRNRAKAGLCTLGCNRHFTNLQNHMASKHGNDEEREKVKAAHTQPTNPPI